MSKDDFWSKSPLGLSLKRLTHETRLAVFVAYENRRALPVVFNSRISAQNNHDILAFIHDDVWLDDYFLVERIIEGLKAYDVIGVAGNRRRLPNQPSWLFIDQNQTWDDRSFLSGSVAHGVHPFGTISYYGPVPAECELLDGVFLEARKSTLTDNGVSFDPVFDFNFYDMDFCRCVKQKNLRIGTWPISFTHQSAGEFGVTSWQEKYLLYCEKWEK
jgi:hypothetical protein